MKKALEVFDIENWDSKVNYYAAMGALITLGNMLHAAIYALIN